MLCMGHREFGANRWRFLSKANTLYFRLCKICEFMKCILIVKPSTQSYASLVFLGRHASRKVQSWQKVSHLLEWEYCAVTQTFLSTECYRTRNLGYNNLNWPRCSARDTESLALTDGGFCQKQTLYISDYVKFVSLRCVFRL